uniref:CHCH domain-containing protein n=1 Tax=Neobodo designis TaxID=312471 RepID=A0A7S1QD61_NEODS|mmetsp:Transcript_39940/g.123412  ORF Transcript_39940/g.123412 Transcript_39940/m.123412 type:complete len:140 (+) Transcript_39940:90-509(+)
MSSAPHERYHEPPPLRDGDTFPTFAGEPDQVNPPYNIPDPARVTLTERDRWVPSGIKPTYMGFAWHDFKGRYLPPDQSQGIFSRLFGTNKAATKEDEELHPCRHMTGLVHQCLDKNANDANMCRSVINIMEGCFREYKW